MVTLAVTVGLCLLDTRSGLAPGAVMLVILALFPPLFYRAGEHIAFLGVPLREWSESALRAMTAVVPQHVHIFSATLRDNLRMAAQDADDEQLCAVWCGRSAWRSYGMARD